MSETTTTPAFSLVVTLKFTAEEHKQTFLREFAPLAAYIKDNEQDTIAYEVLLSDQDPLQAVIFERYRDKETAFLKVHRSSAPFLEFRPKLKALQEAGHVTIEGHSYIDSRVGFGDRVI
jgi:quinol monooxygenase YgiN